MDGKTERKSKKKKLQENGT